MRRALLLVPLLAAACGGTSSPSASLPQSPTPSPSPSPSVKTATVGQYASLIDQSAADYHKVFAKFEDDCLVSSLPLCPLVKLNVVFTASALAINLHGAMHDRPGNQTYVGPPPAEIASLVTDTLADAKTVSHGSKMSLPLLNLAAQRLDTDLDGWKPYL